MAKCSECDGTGVCHNGIHDSSGVVDEVLGQTTGSMYTCKDCKEDSDNPGDCHVCGGSGEVDDS